MALRTSPRRRGVVGSAAAEPERASSPLRSVRTPSHGPGSRSGSPALLPHFVGAAAGNEDGAGANHTHATRRDAHGQWRVSGLASRSWGLMMSSTKRLGQATLAIGHGAVRTNVWALQHTRRWSDMVVSWVVRSRVATQLLTWRFFLPIALAAMTWAAVTGRSVLSVTAIALAVWVCGELAVIGLSIYVAKRWAFIPHPKHGSAVNDEPLIMVRRNAERKASWLRPPQVIRWDVLGVFTSWLFGQLASITLWRPLRAPYYRAWSRMFSANVDEVERPLDEYLCLQEFFTRALKPGVRPIAATALVSPVDGRVVVAGPVTGDQVEQVKGVTYSVTQFLGEELTTLLGTSRSRDEPGETRSVRTHGGRGDGGRVGAGSGSGSGSGLGAGVGVGVGASASASASARAGARASAGAGVAARRATRASVSDRLAAKAPAASENDLDEPNPFDSENDSDFSDVDMSSGALSAASESLDDDEDVTVMPTGRIASTVPKSTMSSEVSKRLWQIVIYLAPGDYHRVHAAAAADVHALRHFPGTLFPISPLVARLIPNLFALNERVILSGRWRHGYFSQTFVGAYNVGSIEIKFDSSTKTNRVLRDFVCPNLELFSYGGVGCFAYNRAFATPLGLVKGEEVGRFKLGSTIVLIFEAPADWRFAVGPGDRVRLGQALGAAGDEKL